MNSVFCRFWRYNPRQARDPIVMSHDRMQCSQEILSIIPSYFKIEVLAKEDLWVQLDGKGL